MQFVDSLFAFPRPRQAAHFLWTFAIIMSLRLLFHGCAPIPGALEIHPGLAMIPVAGIQFGAAGVLGASAAAFVSDLVLKTPGTACRVIGYGLCAFLPFLVWNGLARETAGASKRSGSARALIACLAGGFAISTWGPINAVAQGVHQFAFLALCQFLVFLVYLVYLGYLVPVQNLGLMMYTHSMLVVVDLHTHMLVLYNSIVLCYHHTLILNL